VGSMMQDILMMEDDNFAIAGVVMVQDMANVTMSYVLSLSPTLIRKSMTCFQQGYPQRIKGSHFFNISPVFEKINSLFTPFLKEKIKKRMSCIRLSQKKCFPAAGPRYNFVRNGIVDQHKLNQADVFKVGTMMQDILMMEDDNYAIAGVVIVQDMANITMMLPAEYGGEGGKIDDIVAHWKAKVESYRDWFMEDAQYKTDEKKRPGKPKTTESVFGLDGSFRQLSVD
ncbi:CRAL TRIO domain containing protein, partial [Asbolus verrucosus]